MLTLHQVSKYFSAPHGAQAEGLHDISLHLPKGQISGFIGPSGAGKSTLLRLMNGLIQPDKGRVALDSAVAKQGIGMIFQHFNLLNTLTVYDNIALPLNLKKTNPELIDDRIKQLAGLCHITQHLSKYPGQLSGGQKQRVAIARALAPKPYLLLADEATSALDPESTASVLSLLQELNQELDLSIALVTHEMQVIKKVCDYVFVLDKGHLVEHNTTLQLFLSPQHPTTSRLVANLFHTTLPHDFKADAPGALCRIAYLGDSISKPLLSTLTQRFGVMVNIIQASIEPIKKATLGIMLVYLEGDHPQLQESVQFLQQQGCRVEVLGE